MPMPTHLSIPRQQDAVGEPDAELARLRHDIDAVDDELIALLARRTQISHEIQTRRVLAGGPRIQHGRERQILARYREGLGAEGSKVALALLELCRGRR